MLTTRALCGVWRTRSAALTCAVLLGAGALPARAQQPALTALSVGLVSRTASDWPQFVAEAQGYFVANGLKVEMINTGSAAAGAQQLTAGALDIAAISTIQVIEAIQGGAPIKIVAEHSTKVPYLVLGRKGVTSLAQLKGKTIIVGGPNDVTRVFMDRVLASANLKPDDYTYTYAGATTERFAALNSGGVDAAILFPPFSYRAVGQGFPVLADVSTYYPSFLFGTFAVRPEWAKTHGDLVVRYLKGFLQAVRWLYDPVNKARAIQILSDATNASPADAAQTYDLFITKLHLYPSTGTPSPASLGPVLDALVKIGAVKAPAPPPSSFYDTSFVAAANAQLGRR